MSFIQAYGWLLGGLIGLFLVAIVGAWISAALGRSYPLTVIEDRGKPGATELVAIAHGYARGGKSMEGISRAIREVCPDADILRFDYNRHLFSNRRPNQIAAEMDDKLNELQDARKYERIILVGFSMGALLIRKAYVYGCGSIADSPVADGLRETQCAPRAWVKQVRRLVLLAGMNRGWNPQNRARYSPYAQRFVVHLFWVLARLTKTGGLIKGTMRGEPFVANLRLQWLEVMRTAEKNGLARPRVIQFLGDSDDVVTAQDSRDVTVARDFIWVVVNNTTHPKMIELGEEGSRLERKKKIQSAFGDETALEKLRRSNLTVSLDEDKLVKTVVFVLHGIRDMGEWTSNFEAPLQEAYLREHTTGEKLYVHRASYGYFAMGPFLLWADRQKNVRWFMDQVTELKARFPNLQEIHFIGHSNGTYILASALEKYVTLKVEHVVLAGSVVRRDFPWSSFAGRVKQVRNYVGSRDIVVGWFPCLFEKPGFRIFNRDIGSAGFNGFEDGFVQPMETRFVRGGHGAALVKENVPSIVDFIIHGKRTDVASVFVEKQPLALTLSSNVCWLVWLILIAIVLYGGWKSPYAGEVLARHFGSALNHESLALVWSSRAIYAILVLLVLKTI
ncbi:MAG TPA: alpha/beta hydrolase [Verrucomicrobiae bacterium]|nr:alpha/beta hydrolase [Verrucomicrobiae bacterium]